MPMIKATFLILFRCLMVSFVVQASSGPALAEDYVVHDIAPGLWAIEGPAEQRNAENLGNNASFGLVETRDGAVLIDPGGSQKGAEALYQIVAGLTDQKVAYVINTGGQDHRWLGNAFWQDQGAQVIASKAAVTDQQARGSVQMSALAQLMGPEALAGTAPSQADITFDTEYDLVLGGVLFEIRHVAPAHTPGDSFVWLPETRTVFTGDIVYVGRVLGVMSFSDSAGWLDAFAAIAALAPDHLVPGHGPATSLAQAQADTGDYLVNLRDQIGAYIEAGGDIIGAVEVDQSGFAHLAQFDALARRNAQAVFEQMEWE